VVCNGPSNYLARKEINPDAQIQPTFSGAQICDIAGPDLIGSLWLKFSVKCVRRNKLTMIAIGRFLVSAHALSVDAMLCHQGFYKTLAAF
jgi:hypothetical protein